MTKDLSCSNHIKITVNKANKLLGSVKRSVGTANVNVSSLLYKLDPVQWLEIIRPAKKQFDWFILIVESLLVIRYVKAAVL